MYLRVYFVAALAWVVCVLPTELLAQGFPADDPAERRSNADQVLSTIPGDGDFESFERRFRELERRTHELEAREARIGSSRVNRVFQPAGMTMEVPPTPDDTVGGRVLKLEEAWKKFKSGQEKKSGKKPTLRINGRLHLDSWSFSDNSDGISFFENPISGTDPENRVFFRRIRLKFEGDITDNMFYRMQFDVHSPDEPEMKDIYIGFRDLPVVQRIKVGNQKRPIGLDHLNSSRYNIFIERPLVVEAFNEDARRLGLAAYSNSDDDVYHWAYGVFAMENIVDDGLLVGDSGQWSANARLASSPWYDEESGGTHYFHWAISGMVARPDGDNFDLIDTNRNQARFRTRAELRSRNRWINTRPIAGAQWYEIMGLESIFNAGPLQIVGEYQFSWMQRDTTTVGTGPDVFFHGAYIYAAYMLSGEHVPYDRKSGTIGRVRPFNEFSIVDRCTGCEESGWGAWQVALRYSYLDLTDKDIQGGIENNVTLGLVWYFNANSSLQFNAVYGDIDEHRPTVNGGFTDGHFTALGTRLRLNF